MDNTEISTVATVISTFITLIAAFGKPVYNKVKETGWFSITDLSKIEELAEQPQNERLQGRVEGMLETRIGNEEGFEDKMKDLVAELKGLEAQGYFKRNIQIGDDNENDQSGGEGAKSNLQAGNRNISKQ